MIAARTLIAATGVLAIAHSWSEPAPQKAVEEIIVTGSIERSSHQASAAARIDATTIKLTQAEHVHEVLVRLPGVLVQRGSGEEHLTAIRSEVLTGTGSCGAFLFLEDGIPLRPQGFCNVNGLFEGTAELASGIEVLRGPGSALFGGNALNGVLNFVSPPIGNEGLALKADIGRWRFGQLRATYDASPFRIDAVGTTTDGYRDHTGFGEQKLLLQHEANLGDWQIHNRAFITNLNQETGGFVIGKNAYRDSDLRKSNPNPEAFRDAWSAHLSSEWQLDAMQLTLYGRSSNMRFLQHFNPGQPLERTGQTSGGINADYLPFEWMRVGANLELATGDVYEFQRNPAVGSPAVVATRPVGVHYDYEVDSRAGALYYDINLPLDEANEWFLVHSGRYEYIRYAYNNKSLDGNTRDNGTACGFGGCLFNRVADRNDEYNNLAGRLGIRREFDQLSVYAVVGRGFRPPQTGELYRLQRGQNVADLDDETLDSAELGLNYATEELRVDAAVFAQRKRNFIFRDAAGFNVSNGRTKSHGIELATRWQATEEHAFDVALTYAIHEYDFSRAAAAGEVISKGNDVDTAPKWLGSAHWRYSPSPDWLGELEVVYQGKYFVDAANSADYSGHTLINLRGRWQATKDIAVTLRVMNLLNKEYADRADIAFGNYRYFPGEPLRAYLGVEWKP